MSDKEDEIIKKLDTIIGLLAIRDKERDEQIKILTSLDFSFGEIEKITGIPSTTARRLSTAKKVKPKEKNR